MYELTRDGEQLMTVQEVAEVLGVTDEAIKKHIRELWPNLFKHGVKTYLDQKKVFQIKTRMQQTTKVVSAKTDFEMYKQIAEVEQWLKFKLQLAEQERDKANAKVAVLTHVNKTYTATEIGKELKMHSAQELNKWLRDKGVQFLQNGTWVPYSKYATQGYFDIKQQVLDNGTVVYDRKITQIGREFILHLFEASK